PAQPFTPNEKPVFLERAHDDRNCLRRKSAKSGYFRFRQSAMAANKKQHQPLIIGTYPDLVRAAADIHNGGRRRRRRLDRLSHNVILPPAISARAIPAGFMAILLSQRKRSLQY